MKAAATLLVLLKFFTSCHGWTCTTPPQQFAAAQIDAGLGMVVMTDKNANAFILTGSSWPHLSSVPLKHVSVGLPGIWGVGDDARVYKFAGGEFFPIYGQELKQLDVGGEGQVVGVTDSNTIHCLNASSASSIKKEGALVWNKLPGQLMYFSCGPNGCFGVNSFQQIYFTKVSPITCSISGWIKLDGIAVNVKVGSDGSVFVVNPIGEVYQRTGISDSVPQGTGWTKIDFCVPIKHLSYDLGRLWLVAEGGVTLKCTN